jgi:predicted DNA-binding protein
MSQQHQERIKQLKAGQSEIKTWLQEVNRKIVEMEDSYIAETNLGNIIRGFDIDGKDQKKKVDDKDGVKEKLFSCSSYEVFIDTKMNMENDQFRSSQVRFESLSNNHNNNHNSSSNPTTATQQQNHKGTGIKGNKRGRKSLVAKKEDADYGQYGDY